MKNLSVRSKIAVGFMLIAAVGLALGITGILSVTTFTGATRNLLDTKHHSDQVGNVLQAHFIWRQGITEAVATGAEFKGSLDPNTCALGNWLNSPEAKSITDPEILSLLNSVLDPHAYIHTNAARVIDSLQAGNPEEAQHLLASDILPKTQDVISLLTQIDSCYATLMEEMTDGIIEQGTFMTLLIVAFVVIALVIAVILTLYISGLINKPLVLLTAFMKKAGTTGDLSLTQADIDVIGKCSQIKDEIGQCISAAAAFVMRITDIGNMLEVVADGDLTADLALLSDKDSLGLSMQKMISNLNNMFGEINSSTEQVSTGSKQIADGAQALAQGSTQQAAAVEQLSASISEISHKTRENAEMAGKAASLAGTIKKNAEKGSSQMDEMVEAVKEINEASQSIRKVISVIDNIAFQTNILALNAAVEAARAGQHGKGFAVVAEEGRSLAAKSAEAAKDTGSLIANSIEKAELGARIADETSASLTDIVEGINESNQIVSDIASSSEEQNLAITQINKGIDQVAQVVQQNSATAEESAAASEEMSSQSQMLESLVAQFKIRGSSGRPALSASRPRKLDMPGKTTYTPTEDGFGKY